MNEIKEYYCHKTYTPPYLHRQFENDFHETEESTLKRAALIALPFLSLYRPLGRSISVGMNGVRAVTNGLGTLQATTWSELATRTSQVALAFIALSATLIHFTLGLFITTGSDLLLSCAHMLDFLLKGDWGAMQSEFLQALSSGLYLAILMTGSLEVVLASLLIQALTSLIQAQKEFEQGRTPEALAKTLMGFIRLYQADRQVELIKRKNQLQKHYAAFMERVKKGRNIDHLFDHPLVTKKDQHVTFTDANGVLHDLGSPNFGYGKQLVKGMNLTFKEVNGKTHLSFKVNHVHRDRLEKVIQKAQSIPRKELHDLLNLSGSHIKSVEIRSLWKQTHDISALRPLKEIHLQGLGQISVGASPSAVGLYDIVEIEMNKGASLYDFHEALSFFDLEDALRASAKEDLERMKLGHLFHTFAPREATPFERTEAFFNLSLEELKQEMERRSPKIRTYFEKYLPKMELREIYPRRMRYAMDGLAEDLQSRGAIGLTAALTGAHTKEAWESRVADLLQMGLLSHETRHRLGMRQKGLSWGYDFITGGSDSAFTQMVTDKNRSFREYVYDSPIRLLFSPKALETGSYQYHDDNFGTRQLESGWLPWRSDYRTRPNIFEFLDEERRSFQWDNEVMLKERIDPKWITGIVVPNEEMKSSLIASLESKKITVPKIYVGDAIHKKMFAC